MHVQKIFKELEKKALQHSHFFGRKLLVVTKTDFLQYQDDFVESLNIFTHKKTWRTKDRFKHIHAVLQQDLVEFHYDYGNVSQSLLMAVPHFFFDVIPYFF